MGPDPIHQLLRYQLSLLMGWKMSLLVRYLIQDNIQDSKSVLCPFKGALFGLTHIKTRHPVLNQDIYPTDTYSVLTHQSKSK